MMVQLNLLPDVKKEFLHAQRMRNFVMSICIVVTIGVVGALLILGGILGGQAIKKSAVTNDIKKNNQTIINAQDKDELDKYMTVQNQLANIGGLHEKEVAYSRLFSWLQKLNPAMPNNAELTSVKILNDAGERTIELEGTTRDFQSLGVYKTTLIDAKIRYSLDTGSTDPNDPDRKVKEELLFESVNVVEASISQSSETPAVNFRISVVYNEAAFAPDSIITEDSPIVTKQTTSDADQSAPSAFKQTTDTEGGEQ